MNRPDDKLLCRLLYAYELGLLKGEQLDEFEVHLIECPDCRKQADEFLPAARLLKHDREIQGFVEGIQAGPLRPRVRRSQYIQAVVALAAVVVFLVLKPWNLEFRHTQEAIASENRLAVLYVGAPSESEDDVELGQTIAGLLTADLSESRYLQAISSQRLHDAARQLGLEGLEQVDLDHAGAVAREVDARWMLIANLVADRAERRLLTQLIDVASGAVIATQSAAADTSASVFSLIDDLTVQLKSDLGLPSAALDEPDPMVADLTSHSVKAYQLYLKGVDLAHKMYFDDAKGFFFKAVKLDSTFAMACYYLSLYDTPSWISKAVEYSARATRKEQMFIMARNALLDGDTDKAIGLLESITQRYPDEKEAFFQLGQFYRGKNELDKGIFYFEKSLDLDPFYKRSLNELAYSYNDAGRLEDALKTLDRYAAAAPDEANPHDSRGDILCINGRLDEGIAAYRRALEIKPDFTPSADKLFYAYLHNGEYEAAEQELLRWEQGCHPDSCLFVHWSRANALILRGQYHDALLMLDRAIAVDEQMSQVKGRKGMVPGLRANKAELLLELDSPALDDAGRAVELVSIVRPGDKLNYRTTLSRALAQAGKSDKAADVITQLRADLYKSGEGQYLYWLASGYLALTKGDTKTAIDSFEEAAKSRRRASAFMAQYMLGKTLLEAGQAERAVEVLQGQDRMFSETRMMETPASGKIHYYLARAYEETNRLDQAIRKYEFFLDLWANADSTLPELQDARTRLTRLKAGS
jgi:tetratricopeptide (TPR) repeat protein